jgi:hypothetical protein
VYAKVALLKNLSCEGAIVKRYLATAALSVALTLGSVTGYRALADAPQLHMHTALHHLEEAKKELDLASHEKGGHRGRALDLTQNAIEEVQAGIQFGEEK